MDGMSKLLINEVPLMCLPRLAVKIGLNEALFIQQLHYWVDRSKNIIEGRQWVYNTVADWSKQFPFWSQKTLSRTISNLEKQGLVISGNYNQKGYDRTKWYTIDYDALERLEKDQSETEENGELEEEAPKENDVSVSDQSIGTNCLHEENQGFTGTVDSGQSIETNCPYEENQGLPDYFTKNAQNDRLIETSCPHPLGQSVSMESDNLSSPIPENNNRDFSEKTTTTNTQDKNIVVGNMDIVKNPMERLLFVMPNYGIALITAKRFIAEYGLSAVEQQFELLKKASQKGNINNPAGWLHMALREGYVDTVVEFKKFQDEKKATMREKAAEIERQQLAVLQKELDEEANQFEIREDSPFYAVLAKFKKEQDDNKPM